MSAEKTLLSVLQKTLNKSEEELQGLLYEDGKNEKGEPAKVLKTDAENIALHQLSDWFNSKESEWRKKNQTIAQDKHGQGVKEMAEKYERIISDLTGYKSDLKGEDYVREAISFSAKNKTDGDFKTNPEFLKYEAEMRKQYEAKLKEANEKFSFEKTGWQKERTFDTVSEKIQVKLDSMKPILPQSPEARATQIKMFREYFKNYDFQDNTNGGFIILKDGQRLENLGNPIEFDIFIESTAKKFFDFPVQDQKRQVSPGADGVNTEVKICKNIEEYKAEMANAKTPQERIALRTAHEGKGLW
jgi:hypothetical protein